jgi:ABC-type spermidine/putrescine transport system permease subunit II
MDRLHENIGAYLHSDSAPCVQAARGERTVGVALDTVQLSGGQQQRVALARALATSLLSGLALIYVFGNQGFLKRLLGGTSLYGPVGIVGAEVLYCFPSAVLILSTALTMADGRLYEAAEALGTGRARVFRTITLPGARYGLISAAFVVFGRLQAWRAR